jgi:hypothetical protein
MVFSFINSRVYRKRKSLSIKNPGVLPWTILSQWGKMVVKNAWLRDIYNEITLLQTAGRYYFDAKTALFRIYPIRLLMSQIKAYILTWYVSLPPSSLHKPLRCAQLQATQRCRNLYKRDWERSQAGQSYQTMTLWRLFSRQGLSWLLEIIRWF